MQGLAESVKQQITRISREISASLNSTIDSNFMRQVGEEAKWLIFVRTKLGYGVGSQGGVKQKLKPLSPFYIELRKILKKESMLDPSTSPKKSNLTNTGQMLASIQVKRASNGIVWLGPMGYRDDRLTNEQVANTVSKDRPFMFLSDLETKKLKRFAQNNFTSVFKQRFRP
jgi:hypothetical protein